MHSTRDPFDSAVDQVDDSTRASQRAAHRTLERVAESAASLRDQAKPVVDRWAERASDAAHDSASWMRDRGDRVRYQVGRASDRTVGYVREDPVRAVMMAAAAGALLYAVVRLMSSRDDR